jgi:hypothetical protein
MKVSGRITVNLFYILDIYGFCYNKADSDIFDFHSSRIGIGTVFPIPRRQRTGEKRLSFRGEFAVP